MEHREEGERLTIIPSPGEAPSVERKDETLLVCSVNNFLKAWIWCFDINFVRATVVGALTQPLHLQ